MKCQLYFYPKDRFYQYMNGVICYEYSLPLNY